MHGVAATGHQKMTKETLPWGRRLAYGTGHILNDMVSCLYFGYLMLFLEKALQLDSLYAGMVFMSGQIADGISTVGTGYLSDKDIDCWLYKR